MKKLKRNLDDLIDPDTWPEPTPQQIKKFKKNNKSDKTFQKAVIEREENICLLCEERINCSFTPICAHHIIYKRYSKSRHDPINGAGLCVKCHQWAHKHPKESEKLIIKLHVEKGIIKSVEWWEGYKREVIK